MTFNTDKPYAVVRQERRGYNGLYSYNNWRAWRWWTVLSPRFASHREAQEWAQAQTGDRLFAKGARKQSVSVYHLARWERVLRYNLIRPR